MKIIVISPKIISYLHHTAVRHTGHWRSVPVRHGAYRCRRPLRRIVTSKPVQRWRCTYTIALSVTVPAVIASVGPTRWTWAFRGPGCAVTCNDCNGTRKRTVVSVGHICSSVVVVVIGSPSATACTDPPCPAWPSARLLCDVCVGSLGGLPPCLCIIDVLSNGRNKERKKNTHIPTPAHCAILL